jgi:hypothetical protein
MEKVEMKEEKGDGDGDNDGDSDGYGIEEGSLTMVEDTTQGIDGNDKEGGDSSYGRHVLSPRPQTAATRKNKQVGALRPGTARCTQIYVYTHTHSPTCIHLNKHAHSTMAV